MLEVFAKELNAKKADARRQPAGARCPICKDGDALLWASVARYKYLRCGNCSLVYLDGTPSLRELQQFYNTSFEVDRDSQAQKVDRQAQPLLALVEKFLPNKGKLLEIGCSYGYLLKRAQQAGWRPEGVEISLAAADWARRTLDVPVHAGMLEDVLPALTPPYDAVVMLHVLEHAPEPSRLVLEAKRLLRPGGILVIKTPNSSSFVASLCGRTWEWLTPPAHIYLFSPVSLRYLLVQGGFQIETLKTQRGDAHNTLFEITRSMTKRIFPSDGKAPTPGMLPPSRTAWYRGIESASDLVYGFFEPLESLFFNRWLRHPELLAVGRLSG